MLKTRWSEFSGDGRELVINDQRTPFNWNNFLFSRDGLYRMEVDQRGRGNSYYNYDQNQISRGRGFYLRDEVGRMRSLTGGEAPDASEHSLCRQQPGRSVFETADHGVESTFTVVLDPDRGCEIDLLEISNRTGHPQTLELTACQFVRLAGSDNGSQLDHTEFHPELRAMVMRRYHSECAPNRYAAYFVSELAPESGCGLLEDFYGADVPLAEADALRTPGALPATQASAAPPIFAMRYTLKLAAGETRSIPFEFGIADTLEDAIEAARAYTPARARDGAAAAAEFYRQALTGGKLRSPEFNFDFAYNTWTRLQLYHQNLNGRNWNIYIWRNHLQDGSGYLLFDPAVSRRWIRQLCSLSKADGFVPRTTAKGKSYPGSMGFYFTQRHNDIGSWLGMCAAEYFLETGDLAFLDETVFNPDRKRDVSILEAIEAGLIWTLSQRGVNGFIRFLDGDWSDPLEKAGRRGIGESCWTAMAIVRAVRMFAPIMRAAGHVSRAERLERGAAEVADSLNRLGWDGNWYIRGVTDDGVRFCTANDPDAKISMLVQAWAVLSGVASPERCKTIMREVDARCLTDFGPMLYGPPYLTEREGIGRESAKRPGCGENGSCYTHGAMMLAAAKLELGDADGALDIMQKTLSIAPDDRYDIRRSTPLWWCNYYQSTYGATPGRSSNFTSSGGPSWFMMNIAERIFGLKPQLDGMLVEPCFPTKWREAGLERCWRGSVYQVEVRRTGRRRLVLDGVELAGNRLPLPAAAGERHQVLVEI